MSIHPALYRSYCALLLLSGCWLLPKQSWADEELRRTAVVQVVEKVAPAVVAIEAEVISRARDFSDPFFLFFAPPRMQKNVSSGSGVLIDAKGYVLTNHHVIATARAIQLELSDGRRLPAEILGSSPRHDLAVLQAKGNTNFPFVPLASSQDLMIGEPVVAIGNSLGRWRHTVTTGIISALHRSAAAGGKDGESIYYRDLIQTQASINPGNSGGPLLNIYGNLIGINTAIDDKAQSIGFAIPSDKAKRIVQEILRYQTVRLPYFGFEFQDLTPELAQSFGISKGGGGMVASVDSKGPAHLRLQDGDIVLSVEGLKIDSEQELRLALTDAIVGETVQFEIFRSGNTSKIALTPSEFSPSQAVARLQQKNGLQLTEIGMLGAYRSQLDKGTLVVSKVSPGSFAAQIGLQNGDLIRSINGKKVIGLEALGKALSEAYWRGRVTLLVQRGQNAQQIEFTY